MPESTIGVTAGSGLKLHTFNRTIGANSVEDEVVLLGENYLASYSTSTANVSFGTATSHPFQLMAGASLKVRVRRIQVYQLVMATAAAMLELNLLRLTTAGTGGASVPTVALDTSDAASGAASMVLPTVKGTEGALLWRGSAYLMQTLAASTPFSQPIMDLNLDTMRMKPIIIAAGTANGIALKNTGAHAGATFNVVIWFDESNF